MADDRKGQRMNADDERDAVRTRFMQQAGVENKPAQCRIRVQSCFR